MFNILSWLPVKSLLLFKSVCKLWLSIISDPKFIKIHLANSRKQHAYVPCSTLLVKITGYYDSMELFSVDSSEDTFRLNLPPQLSPKTRVVGSCNGLVCLANNDCDNIYIWNLSLKHYKILPTPNKRSKPKFNVVGFGYDSVFNDYRGGNFDTFKLEAEMYSANADSWKEMQLPETARSFWPYRFYERFAFAIDGVLYFNCLRRIMSFDLHNEVFKLYDYPNSFCYISRKSNVLDFEGSAAMVFPKSVGDESVLSLWTLDDVCGKASWTKELDLELDYKFRYSVYWNLGVGRFVLKDINSFQYFLMYDYKKKETRTVAWVPEGADMFNYTESLVSLKGFEQQER